jgi:hypothetical protein
VISAQIDDDRQLRELSSWIEEREPCFSIVRPQRDALLFEPDGTLYGLSVRTPMSIRFERRERRIAPGDVIVVPQGLALDVEPEVDLLGIRCTGTTPDHFRERFIQVWGYDHFPSRLDWLSAGGAQEQEVIPSSDLRFHVHASVLRLPEAGPVGRALSTNADLLLLVGYEGAIHARTREAGRAYVIRPGEVVGVGPEEDLLLSGSGITFCLRLVPEPVFHALRVLRKAGIGPPISPEVTQGPEHRIDPAE